MSHAVSAANHATLSDVINTLLAEVLSPTNVDDRPERSDEAAESVGNTLAAHLKENHVVPVLSKENPTTNTNNHPNENVDQPHATNVPMPDIPQGLKSQPVHAANLPAPRQPSATRPRTQKKATLTTQAVPVANPAAEVTRSPHQARPQKIPQAPIAGPIPAAIQSSHPAPPQPSATQRRAPAPQTTTNAPTSPVANAPGQTTTSATTARPRPKSTQKTKVPRPSYKPINPSPLSQCVTAPSDETAASSSRQPAVVHESAIASTSASQSPTLKRKADEDADTLRKVKSSKKEYPVDILVGNDLDEIILGLQDPPVLPEGYILTKEIPTMGFDDFALQILPPGVAPALRQNFILASAKDLKKFWNFLKTMEQEAEVPLNGPGDADDPAYPQEDMSTAPPATSHDMGTRAPPMPHGAASQYYPGNMLQNGGVPTQPRAARPDMGIRALPMNAFPSSSRALGNAAYQDGAGVSGNLYHYGGIPPHAQRLQYGAPNNVPPQPQYRYNAPASISAAGPSRFTFRAPSTVVISDQNYWQNSSALANWNGGAPSGRR